MILRLLRSVLCLAVAAGVLCAGSSVFGQNYKAELLFPGYTGAETLTNFPALVILGTNIPGFAYDQFAAPANGGDLRFANSNESLALNYEIANWNTNGSSYVWVQVPEISGTNTSVWITFGNGFSTNPPVCTTNGSTWSNGYVGVWHLEETGIQHADLAGYNNMVTNTGSVSWSNGIAGKGQYLNGAGSDYMCTPDHSELENMTGLTLEAFVNRAGGGNAQGIVSKRVGTDSQDCYNIMVRGDLSDELEFRVNGSGVFLRGPVSACPTSQWSYVAGTVLPQWSAGVSNMLLYQDGALAAGRNYASFSVVNNLASDVTLGTLNPGYAAMKGRIDEVRISSVARSAAWLMASYMNQASNDVFNGYGVFVRTLLPIMNNAAGASNITSSSAVFNGTMMSTGAAASEAWVYWGTTDGGTNAGAWANTNYFGTNLAVAPVEYSTNVTGLSSNTCYFYRYSAANSNGTYWTAPSETFITAPVILSAADANASESGPDTGLFVVSRPASATNGFLVVNYTISGTAVNGSDYVAIGSSVTIPAGATNANITITPVDDEVWNEGNETVTITRTPRGYITSAPSNSTVVISDNEVPGSWTFKMPVTFSGYNRSGILTNFPVLVVLGTNIWNFFYNQFASPADGGDLRFESRDESVSLNYEIEEWNTNGNSYVWVQVPLLSGTNTGIIACWGNKGMTNLPSYVANGSTWSDGFRGVWHFGGTNDASNMSDSSSSRFNAVNSGGSSNLAGRISNAQNFRSSDSNYLNTAPSSSFLPAVNSPVTLSCWMNPRSIGTVYHANRMINIHSGNPGTTLTLACGNTNKVQIYYSGGGTNGALNSVSTISSGNWYYAVIAYDGAMYRLFVDGALENSVGASLNAGSSYLAKIGTFSGGSDFFDGSLDEVRICNVARSDDWIWACYMNQKSNSSFAAYGKVWTLSGTVITVK